MTSQEMMLPWFGVLVDRDATPDMIALYIPPDLDAPLPGGRFVVRPPHIPQPAAIPQPLRSLRSGVGATRHRPFISRGLQQSAAKRCWRFR